MKYMTSTTSALTLVLLFAAVPAFAAHEDILVAKDGDGRLVTGTAELDDGTYTIGKRTFGFHPAGPLGGLFATTDPGYNAVKQADLPSGYFALPPSADVKFNIVADTIGVTTANFWYWDGKDDDGDSDYYDDVEWTPVPSGYTYKFDKMGFYSAIADGSSSTVNGFVIATTDSDGRLHQHLNMYIDDGDGNASTTVAHGFYLVGISLYMDQPGGVLPSETLYFVPGVGDHTPAQHRDGAVAWVNDNLVPEPASLMVLALGGLTLLAKRSRNNLKDAGH